MKASGNQKSKKSLRADFQTSPNTKSSNRQLSNPTTGGLNRMNSNLASSSSASNLPTSSLHLHGLQLQSSSLLDEKINKAIKQSLDFKRESKEKRGERSFKRLQNTATYLNQLRQSGVKEKPAQKKTMQMTGSIGSSCQNQTRIGYNRRLLRDSSQKEIIESQQSGQAEESHDTNKDSLWRSRATKKWWNYQSKLQFSSSPPKRKLLQMEPTLLEDQELLNTYSSKQQQKQRMFTTVFQEANDLQQPQISTSQVTLPNIRGPTNESQSIFNSLDTQRSVDEVFLRSSDSKRKRNYKNFILQNIKTSALQKSKLQFASGLRGPSAPAEQKSRSLTQSEMDQYWREHYENSVKYRFKPFMKNVKISFCDVNFGRIDVNKSIGQPPKDPEQTHSWKGTSFGLSNIKTDYLLSNMMQQCNNHTNHMFDSSSQQMEAQYKNFEGTFHNYETRVIKQMGIKQAQIPSVFIDQMHKQKARKLHERAMRSPKGNDESSIISLSDISQINPNLSQHPSYLPSQSQSPIDHFKHSSVQPDTTTNAIDLFAHNMSMESIEDTPLNSIQKRQKVMLEETDKFIIRKSAEKEEVKDAITAAKQRHYYFEHPHLCPDQEQLMDDNLSQIVNSSTVYQHLKVDAQNKIQHQKIANEAAKITATLEKHAEQQREEELKSIKKFEKKTMAAMFFGNKKERLVRKFIGILKKRVEQQRLLIRNKTNEQLIEKILKKKDYQAQITKVNQQKKLEDVTVRDKMLEEQRQEYQKAIDLAKLMSHGKSTRKNSIRTQHSSLSHNSGDSTNHLTVGTVAHIKFSPEEIMKIYMRISLETGHMPIQIFHSITKDKCLPLLNTKLEENCLEPLQAVLPKLVPTYVEKVFLINNDLTDKLLLELVVSMFQSEEGMKSLVIVKNIIGTSLVKELVQTIIPSRPFTKLRKFVIKDPKPLKVQQKFIIDLIKQIKFMAPYLKNMRSLTLSKIGLNGAGLRYLGDAVPMMMSLEHLDISSNLLDRKSLRIFIDSIRGQEQLRSLNISFNQAHISHGLHSLKINPSSFEGIMASYLHHSETLLHLDISATGMSIEQCLYIAKKGIRKSKSLLSVHMSGLGYLHNEILNLRECLKVLTVESLNDVLDIQTFDKVEIARIHSLEMNNILKQKISKYKAMKIMADKSETVNAKKIQAQGIIKAPIFKLDEADKLVYQRVLGRNEMLLSHRWTESTESRCQTCNKMTCCLVMWNKKVSETKYHDFFFRHSDQEPVIYIKNLYPHPFLCFKNQIHKMLPLNEFYERLKTQDMRGTAQRETNNEVEQAKYQFLQKKIYSEIISTKTMDPSYWKYQRVNNPFHTADFNPSSINGWLDYILDMYSGKVFQLFNLEKYANLIEMAYEGTPKESIIQDTYMCAFYLPSNRDLQQQLGLVVKHPDLPGIDYMMDLRVERLKHLSVNTVPIIIKQTKKEKIIRYFNKKTSVFAKWRENTPKTLERCFDMDIGSSKLCKFVLKKDDQDATFALLKKYYGQLIEIFMQLICNPATYPSISLDDIIDAGYHWDIYDNYLHPQRLSNIFQLAITDEEMLQEMQHETLSRFEFVEVIVMIAAKKFYFKGRFQTVEESLEELMTKHLLPNRLPRMRYQDFRKQKLYKIDIQDLTTLNLAAMDALYSRFSDQEEEESKRIFSRENSMDLFKAALEEAPEVFGEDNIEDHLQQMAEAFCMSKMTVVNEMEQFQKYNQLQRPEFYEFLARWAELLFEDDLSLYTKLSNLMKILFPIVGHEYQEVVPIEIHSDSDYDDDHVDSIMQKALGNIMK